MVQTKLLDTKDITHYQDSINTAAQVLKGGELVIFPTETVYGIGANARDEGAVAMLYAVKRRPREKEFAYLISSLSEVTRLLSHIPPCARLLMEELWPGPLTIVLPGPQGKDVGIRFPAHKVAQDLIREAGVPVLATSANISGMPPATDAQEAQRYFDGKISIILDGGPCAVKIPSTVVKVMEDSYTILREGAIPAEKISSCIGKVVEVS